MKTCTKCGELKPFSEYTKVGGRKGDLLRSYCKACQRIAAAKWVVANRDKKNAMNAKWRAENRDKFNASCAKWHAANPERVKDIYAKWYEANKERVSKAGAKYRAENADKVNAYQSKKYAANREYYRAIQQNRRARKREAGGKLSTGLVEKLIKLQKGKCTCCGKPLGDDYHLDHRMPLALGGTNTDENIELLCSKCNMQKGKKHPVDFMQQRGFLL